MPFSASNIAASVESNDLTWPAADANLLDSLPRGATAVDLSQNVEDAVERGWVYGSLMFGEAQVRTGHLVVGILETRSLGNALLKISPEFDKIKLDQSFVRDPSDRADCMAIVNSIASLGRDLGMVTTAEGVETAAQLGILRTAGFVEGQGYHFWRPMPAAALTQLLREHSPAAAA